MESAAGGAACERDILAIGSSDVLEALDGRELELIEAVRQAYVAHHENQSSLPHSTFLLFPSEPRNRIIALPAYLNGSINSAGVKWVASFPANVERGMDRASAMLILNSVETGRPKAILEGSIISAKRTAASAALAASLLAPPTAKAVGFIGCGKINLEIATFLLAVFPGLRRFRLYDTHRERAAAFAQHCEESFPAIATEIGTDACSALKDAEIVSFATTAAQPHIEDLGCCSPQTAILHVSLRDLSPSAILAGDNVVDDVDHVCRAQTSIHLTEQEVKHRGFVRCTLGGILTGSAPARADAKRHVIFSPFGLGILDIALGEYVYQRARSEGSGTVLKSFLPESWKRPAAERRLHASADRT